MKFLPALLLLPALTCPLSFVTAQSGEPPKKDAPATGEAKTVERIAAWPKPTDKDQVLVDIERVIKNSTPGMGTQGRDGLIAAGAGAVPFVLERYAKEKDEGVLERLHEVLIGTTGAEHTRLLAKKFEDKLAGVRTFALWRSAAFPDAENKTAAEAAWQRVLKQGARAEPEERYAAALCAASTGSTVGFDDLLEVAATRWDKKKRELRAALDGARGAEASAKMLAKLEGADRKGKVAVLRMLAGCGDRASAGRVKSFLDDEDNQIRVAAINALRGIVDGELPLEELSVFEAVELAKKWKGRS